MLGIDLQSLGSPDRFQHMCFRLAKKEWPTAVAINYSSWDRGADVIVLDEPGKRMDIVWQCKFTRSLGAATRRAIRQSLEVLDAYYSAGESRKRSGPARVGKWILCLPVDPTRVFLGWLEGELGRRRVPFEVWGKTELLRRLEASPDVLQSFFYPAYAEIRRHFRTESLELVRFRLDRTCAWIQPDPSVLHFMPRDLVESPDLVFDVIVRNLGEMETAVTGLITRVRECHPLLHGLPRPGLLLPKVKYRVSLGHGAPGDYRRSFNRVLRVPPRRLERFKICLTDTGLAWRGAAQIVLQHGKNLTLPLPWIQLTT